MKSLTYNKFVIIICTIILSTTIAFITFDNAQTFYKTDNGTVTTLKHYPNTKTGVSIYWDNLIPTNEEWFVYIKIEGESEQYKFEISEEEFQQLSIGDNINVNYKLTLGRWSHELHIIDLTHQVETKQPISLGCFYFISIQQ